MGSYTEPKVNELIKKKSKNVEMTSTSSKNNLERFLLVMFVMIVMMTGQGFAHDESDNSVSATTLSQVSDTPPS